MFSHIMIGANDVEKSKVFYDAILSVLGYPAGVMDAKGR
ncbi:MAG: VOC family protein, partial [Shewanella sp.]